MRNPGTPQTRCFICGLPNRSAKMFQSGDHDGQGKISLSHLLKGFGDHCQTVESERSQPLLNFSLFRVLTDVLFVATRICLECTETNLPSISKCTNGIQYKFWPELPKRLDTTVCVELHGRLLQIHILAFKDSSCLTTVRDCSWTGRLESSCVCQMSDWVYLCRNQFWLWH